MNKILIIFYGESFRNYNICVRGRSTDSYTVNNQLLTIESHLRLINHIKNNLKYECDNAILSYKLNDELDNLVINKYNPIIYELHDDPNNPKWFYENNGIMEAYMLRYLSTCFKDIIIKNEYSHVLFLRIDWYLKSYFLECLCFDNKIRFGFPDLNSSFKKNVDKKCIKTLENIEDFQVNHAISQFPQKYYYLIFDYKIISYLHQVYIKCLELDIDVNDIDFFIKTLHTCSSRISWNPIFANCGREEKLAYIDHPPFYNRFIDGNINYYVENGFIILNTDDKYSKQYDELIYSEILPWSSK